MQIRNALIYFTWNQLFNIRNVTFSVVYQKKEKGMTPCIVQNIKDSSLTICSLIWLETLCYWPKSWDEIYGVLIFLCNGFSGSLEIPNPQYSTQRECKFNVWTNLIYINFSSLIRIQSISLMISNIFLHLLCLGPNV